MTLVQYIAFALVLVGTTLLYKLYYHSSLLQGERQACFAARYAAQQYISRRKNVVHVTRQHIVDRD